MNNFRECINCDWVSCTILKTCMLEVRDRQPSTTGMLLEIEAYNVATKKRQQEYAIREERAAEKRRHNIFAPLPLSGFARRKRKNGSYGRNYNYLHSGKWHAVMRFFKSH